METQSIAGITVEELDHVIRRVLQEHFSKVQPPSNAWGSIQFQLGRYKRDVLAYMTHGKSSKITNINSQYTPQE